MVVSEYIEDLQRALNSSRSAGKRIGFVPTMGALHAGHVSLLSLARTHCDVVVVSIFVNPTQFNQTSDLAHYPRTLEKDLEMLNANHCDVVFVPPVTEIYPDGLTRGHWDFGLLSSVLEGHFRPGHFDGVLTVVKRLFEIVQPGVAFFGEKDFQQLAHIRRMVKEEHLPVEIISGPTLRDPDGLAMSSRNARLTPEQRVLALNISRILYAMHDRRGEFDPPGLEQWGRAEFHLIPGIRLEYLEIIDGHSFSPLAEWSDSDYAVILCACYVEKIRLIDNLILKPDPQDLPETES
jgi:pantoate--beta-alanine ligase